MPPIACHATEIMSQTPYIFFLSVVFVPNCISFYTTVMSDVSYVPDCLASYIYFNNVGFSPQMWMWITILAALRKTVVFFSNAILYKRMSCLVFIFRVIDPKLLPTADGLSKSHNIEMDETIVDHRPTWNIVAQLKFNSTWNSRKKIWKMCMIRDFQDHT